MEKNVERNHRIAWIIRIILFVLFALSAVAKMFPLWAFEKQLVDLGICDWCVSHYLARFIIGFELALGIAILQPHLLKKIVIPTTIALLVAFCGHLIIQMIQYGAMNGNCGCFGQLIPMTPLEAFVKNIVTIGLLVYLYKLLPTKNESWQKFINLLAIFLACALLMFTVFPFTPCSKEKKIDVNDAYSEIDSTLYDNMNLAPELNTEEGITPTNASGDTLNVTTPVNNLTAQKQKDKLIKDSLAKANASKQSKNSADKNLNKVVEAGPAKKVSPYSNFAQFNGQKVNVDEGKKVLCFFAPGCDHCQNTAKAMGELAKKQAIPEVYIYFMDEETEKIPEFFKIAGVKYPFQVLSIGNFWDLLGTGSTPGVVCLWNGNIMQSYEGIDKNEFNMEKFKQFVK